MYRFKIEIVIRILSQSVFITMFRCR